MPAMRATVVLALALLLAGGVHARADAASAVERDAAAPATVRHGSPAQARNGWPRSGRVTYEVLRGEGGLKLGEARHRWQHDGRRYSMATEVETTGVVGLLYSFHYVQSSEGRVEGSALLPERFRVEQQGKEAETAHFDWPAGKVEIARRGKCREYAIGANDQDVLSVWHLIALRDGREPPTELNLVTNRTAAPTTVEVLGRETIAVPVGTLDARHVRMRARSGKLRIDMWLSEDHHYVPVRIVMADHKGEVLDQRAVAIELEGD